jgi:hypothetical protein
MDRNDKMYKEFGSKWRETNQTSELMELPLAMLRDVFVE